MLISVKCKGDMKALLTIIVMITITPIMATIGLISFDPSNWGGGLSVGNVLTSAFFGVITLPLWITYIPSLVIAPIVMSQISKSNRYQELSFNKLICLSIPSGAIIGIIILSPLIIMAFENNTSSNSETIKLVSNWVFAGALSGAVSLPIITLIYRRKNT